MDGDAVIIVTRLNGPPFAINPDLVQRIDHVPDTILTLVDGTKYIVQETMDEVIDLIANYRADLIARAQDRQQHFGLYAAPDQTDSTDESDESDDDDDDDDDAPLAPPVQLHPRRV